MSPTASRDWDAQTYHRVANSQLEWGREVIERLPLMGDETVLDAGCGSGRVSRLLLERLPRGRLIAVDGSPSMVEKARETLGGRAEVFQADLSELALAEPVDAIFSNAVFHWIPDHDRLFERLHSALRPGGRLVAQCGGKGNVAALDTAIQEVTAQKPFAEFFAGWSAPWNFSSPEAMTESLERAGFEDVNCWLEPKLVQPEEPREFLRAVSLGPHLERLPEDRRDDFIDAIADAAGEPLTLQYVRLNISARRPA